MRQQDKIAVNRPVNLEITVSTRAHAQCEICTAQIHLKVPSGGNNYTTLLSIKRSRFHL